MNSFTKLKIAAPIGFAIFAMFFGAGNLVFPLLLGAHASGELSLTMFGFLLTGVGVPLLGLFGLILYQGDYWSFFSSLGRWPTHILVAILVLLLGVTTANPRCSLITYHTLAPYLPHFAGSSVIFKFLFFSLVFLVSIKKNKLLDLIGYIFSPIKLGLLIVLILCACVAGHYHSDMSSSLNQGQILWHSMMTGYGTMDLLAAFFFCTLIYRHVVVKVSTSHGLQEKDNIKLTVYACIIGAVLLSLVYAGFIIAAHNFSVILKPLATDQLISALAIAVFGKYAALLICLIVSFACFVTSVSLTAVAVDYIQSQFKNTVNYKLILILLLLAVFIMSNLSFDRIMSLSLPILQVLYPALLVFTIFRIINYFSAFRINALPFYLVMANSLFFSLKAIW